MDEATIRHQLREYVKWTTYHWPDVAVVYAGKAFLSLRDDPPRAEEGCCLTSPPAVSSRSRSVAGFPMERIYVQATTRRRSNWPSAWTPASGRVVVDSFEEMERLVGDVRGAFRDPVRSSSALLRDRADTHSYILTGAEDSQVRFRP